MHFIRFLFKQPNIQKLMKLSPPPPAAACRGLTASAAANSLQSRAAPRSLPVCTGRVGFAKRSAPSMQKCRAGTTRFHFMRQLSTFLARSTQNISKKLKAGYDVDRGIWDINIVAPPESNSWGNWKREGGFRKYFTLFVNILRTTRDTKHALPLAPQHPQLVWWYFTQN